MTSRSRQSARIKGLEHGRRRGAPVGSAANVKPVWGTKEPTAEELAAKRAAMRKRNEEHANKFVNNTQGSNPTIFEDVDASNTCKEHSDASKHPPQARPRRTAATTAANKINNPYVKNKKKNWQQPKNWPQQKLFQPTKRLSTRK